MSGSGEHLALLYDLSRRVATFVDLDGLQRFATRRAQEVFGAEGCAIMLHDRERGELYFLPVAAQDAEHRAVEKRLAEIRFPADRGVAGWVLARSEPALVTDPAHDPRFYRGVDQMTGMTTRGLLCAPLRTAAGAIGVITVMNPAPERMTADGLALLDALASDLGVAHEKVLLYERLRGEVVGLRQALRVTGLALIALGSVVAFGAIAAHLAWALPLAELPTRPALVAAVLAIAVGAALRALDAGWLIGRTPPPRL